MSLKGVIIDLDGILVNSLENLADSMKIVLQTIIIQFMNFKLICL